MDMVILLNRSRRYPQFKRRDEGMSLVYVLIAALVLVAGTATLMSRTSSVLLGSLFQGQGQQ